MIFRTFILTILLIVTSDIVCASNMSSVLPSIPRKIATTTTPLQQLKALRARGQLDKAIALGKNHLKAYPKDVDVMLILGLLFYQKKEFTEATQYLNRVLAISPHYMDAKFALINLALAQKQLTQAAALIRQAAKQAPNDPQITPFKKRLKEMQQQDKIMRLETAYKKGDYNQATTMAIQYLTIYPSDETIRLRLGQIYLAQKKYHQAKIEFQTILAQNPKNKEAYLALIDEELAAEHNAQAQLLITKGLKLFPNDPDFLGRRATLYFSQHMYGRSAYVNKKIIAQYPQNSAAREQLKEIAQISPHYLYGLNEVGANSEVDYISDLHEVWQYSTVYFNHDAPWGLASFNLNNTTRFGVTASQGAFNLFPVANNHLYFRLTGAYANEPLLFPTYVAGGEGYVSTKPVELSLGGNYSYILPSIAFTQYTGSISKEWGKYWVGFRPNHYVPQHGKQSTLYTGTLIRYFGPKDTYLKLMFGSGTTPDLANLTTVDFIVIKNNFVTLSTQFPIINHALLLNIGGDYQHWVFPSSRIRNISGITIGLNYRFEGINS